MSAVSSSLVPIERLPPGWETAKVTFLKNGQLKTRLQQIDLCANPAMQYRYDTMRSILLKSLGILAALPFVLCANLLFHIIRTLILVLGILIRSTYTALTEQTPENLQRCFAHWTWEAPAALLQGVRDFVKAPFCALGMAVGVIIGISSRLEGRRLIGRAERIWKGANRRHNITRCKSEYRFIVDLFTNRHSKNCWYLAYCFQPIGPTNAPQVQNIEFLDPDKTKQVTLFYPKNLSTP